MPLVVLPFMVAICLQPHGLSMQKARDPLGPPTFEDNAEFGFGMRISADVQHQHAVSLLLK